MDVRCAVAVFVVAVMGSVSAHGDMVHCWRCDTSLPSADEIEAQCHNGTYDMLSSDNSTIADCESGKCISFTADLGIGQLTFSRGCLDEAMEAQGYCNGTNEFITDATCCETDLCNGPMDTEGGNSGVSVFASLGSIVMNCLILYICM